MNVEVKIAYDEDDNAVEALYIDGEEMGMIRSLFDCPEDASIERSLWGFSDFIVLAERMLGAQARGNTINITYVTVDYGELW